MTSREPLPGDEQASTGRLDSWKEIAAYLRRSMRSARRWEKEEGLPVHRHPHSKRDSVYAYRTELDDWWTNRGVKVADQDGAEDTTSPPETEALESNSSFEEPGREEKVARPSAHAAPRTALIGGGFALAILVVGGVAWLSRSGSRPAPGTLRALPFQARDCVLVSSFENRTGEKLFDGTLDYALGRELSNSRQVTVVSRDRVIDALRLMRKPPDSPMNAALARDVCLRDGEIRALLTGRVEKLGAKYVFSVELVDPKEGTTLAGFSEESGGTDGSLTAIRRISDRVRAALGEAPAPNDSERAGFAKVTTANLRALQLYSRADLLMAKDNNQAAAQELLRQAVAEDPTFASAWIHLAWAVHNQEKPLAEFQPYAETALRLADTTTERERYFIRGSYYHLLGQRENAIAAYEALLALYPDHPWASQNLVALYDGHHDPQNLAKAVRVETRIADSRPKEFFANFQAGYNFLVAVPEPARARLYMRRASELITPEIRDRFPNLVSGMKLLPFTESWLKGDVEAAAGEIDRVAEEIDLSVGRTRDELARQTANGYLTLGRIEAAARTSGKIVDPVVRNDMRTQIAFIQGDLPALRHHLQFQGGRESRRAASAWWEATLILEARVGLLSDAKPFQKEMQFHDVWPEALPSLQGEIALAHRKLTSAIRELEEAGRLCEDPWVADCYLGRESLAAALARRGDAPRAIQVLERNPEKFYAMRGGTGAYWLRNRLQLAKLYRSVGRAEDAQIVEAELSKLLALADPDHPILVELQRLRRS